MGLSTYLFLYYFSINFVRCFDIFLINILNITDLQGIIVLLVVAYAKPISILMGILVATIFLLKKELLNSLKIDPEKDKVKEK